MVARIFSIFSFFKRYTVSALPTVASLSLLVFCILFHGCGCVTGWSVEMFPVMAKFHRGFLRTMSTAQMSWSRLHAYHRCLQGIMLEPAKSLDKALPPPSEAFDPGCYGQSSMP